MILKRERPASVRRLGRCAFAAHEVPSLSLEERPIMAVRRGLGGMGLGVERFDMVVVGTGGAIVFK